MTQIGVGIGPGTARPYDLASRLYGGNAVAYYSALRGVFQDTARTTPATATNDPIGLIASSLPGGPALEQSSAANKPPYHADGYVNPDGVDDFLTSAADVAVSGTKIKANARVEIVRTATNGRIFSIGVQGVDAVGCEFWAWNTTNPAQCAAWVWTQTGPTNAERKAVEFTLPGSGFRNLTFEFDVSGLGNIQVWDGTSAVSTAVPTWSTGLTAAGAFSAVPLTLCAKGDETLPGTSHVQSLIVANGESLWAERAIWAAEAAAS